MLRNKSKVQSPKFKVAVKNLKFLTLSCSFTLYILSFVLTCSAQEEFKYNAKGKRNPFIPLVTPDGRLLKLEPEESNEGLLVEGIIYDKQGLSYAIVNGTIVKIGDEVSGYLVLKIEKNKVIFIKEGQPTEVALKKGEEE